MNKYPKSKSLCRAAGIPAVAFFSLGLGVALATAQDSQSTPPSQSPTTPNNPNNSPMTPSDSRNGTYDATTGNTNPAMANDDDQSSSLRWGERRFLRKAAKGSEKEVALAQLAQQRSSNPQVKQYAQMLVADHEKMNQQLEQLAQKKGVEISSLNDEDMGATGSSETTTRGTANYGQAGSPATTTGAGGTNTTNGTPAATASSDTTGRHGRAGMHEDRTYRELASKSGSDFDHAYLSAMVDDHRKDVKMFQKEAKDAKDAEVRSFADAQVATLQQHLERAQSLMSSAAE
jgi:predicted outer membrane protein